MAVTTKKISVKLDKLISADSAKELDLTAGKFTGDFEITGTLKVGGKDITDTGVTRTEDANYIDFTFKGGEAWLQHLNQFTSKWIK